MSKERLCQKSKSLIVLEERLSVVMDKISKLESELSRLKTLKIKIRTQKENQRAKDTLECDEILENLIPRLAKAKSNFSKGSNKVNIRDRKKRKIPISSTSTLSSQEQNRRIEKRKMIAQ